MELSTAKEATSCAATQELLTILMNPKVHYCIPKSPTTLGPILNEVNPIHTTPSFIRSILILFAYLHLGLLNSHLPSDFSTNILSCPIHTVCPEHLIFLDLAA
jgi:hypothetical protein